MSWVVLYHEPCHDLKLGVMDGNIVDGKFSGREHQRLLDFRIMLSVTRKTHVFHAKYRRGRQTTLQDQGLATNHETYREWSLNLEL